MFGEGSERKIQERAMREAIYLITIIKVHVGSLRLSHRSVQTAFHFRESV